MHVILIKSFIRIIPSLICKNNFEEKSKTSNKSEGLAYVIGPNGNYGYIDKTGKVAIPCQWYDANPFSEGMAAVKDSSEKYGYIDRTGKLVIPCRWKSASSFYRGLAFVTDDQENNLVIDKTGHVVKEQ